jgi:hypothetical protein
MDPAPIEDFPQLGQGMGQGHDDGVFSAHLGDNLGWENFLAILKAAP